MAKAPKDHYVVIVAGGVGSRLWPLSRRARPKQFLKLFSDQSFIQKVYKRAQRITPKENIFIVAPENYSEYLKLYIPEFPLSNFMGEPAKKGTTAAYGSPQFTLSNLIQKQFYTFSLLTTILSTKNVTKRCLILPPTSLPKLKIQA